MNRKTSLTTTLFLILMILATACAKETDNNGTGSARDAFIGRWAVNENWTKLSYEVTISADPNSADGVFISNFGALGSTTPAAAYVSGNKITLDAGQVIDGVTINGSGTLSSPKINWNYTLYDGATLITAVAVYTKQ